MKKPLKEQLKDWKKEKQQENLSQREIEELMGIRRTRYEKRRGAIRQK